MIVGVFDSSENEVYIEVTLRHPASGRDATVRLVVDTGFTGHLLLPATLVGEMGLRPVGTRRLALADGSETAMGQCQVVVDWDGQERDLLAYIAEGGKPLLGVKMLRGFLLTAEFVAGGTATIERV